MHEIIEQAKVNVRNIRQEMSKIIKADKALQEDDYKYFEDQLNKITKDENTRIENVAKNKEKEIMTI
jgi:ribosome recycling factor